MKHYGLTEKGGGFFEVLDAITRICNDVKDTSSLEAEVSDREIRGSLCGKGIFSDSEVSSILTELERLEIIYWEEKPED